MFLDGLLCNWLVFKGWVFGKKWYVIPFAYGVFRVYA